MSVLPPCSPFTPVTSTQQPQFKVDPEETATKRGKVWLVGAGPGDPELLTIKALNQLQQADAVVFDHLVGADILGLIPSHVTQYFVGKASGLHSLPQPQINQLLIDLAKQGQNVVRLKGGDPFIFGRGGEELSALHHAGIVCEIIPGITAAVGASAATGMPLTHRDHAQTLVFATGHLKNGTVDLNWSVLAQPNQTVVIYMGLNALPIICQEMIAHGLSPQTPAAVIHAATTPSQKVVQATLATLPSDVQAAQLQTPALIMIGESCRSVFLSFPHKTSTVRDKVIG